MFKKLGTLSLVLIVIIYIFSILPSCVKIEESIETSQLETREDLSGTYPFTFKTFQKKDGQWFQCKTRASRYFFS